jgi:hypothetical protein
VAVIMPAIIKVRANVIPFIAVRPQSYGFKYATAMATDVATCAD